MPAIFVGVWLLLGKGSRCSQPPPPLDSAFGTPADVRREAQRLIREVGPGGGFILAPSHDMPGDIPLENILALLDALQGQADEPA